MSQFSQAHRTLTVASVAAVLAAFALITYGLYAVFSYRHVVFPWDVWDTVNLYVSFRDGNGSWSALWALHNEHRIFFPRLLILLDYFLASASGNILMFFLIGLHGAHAGLLARAFSGSVAASAAGTLAEKRRDVMIFASIVVMSFFWLKQRENFVWPFQVAWMLNAFFASLAAYLAATRPNVRGLLAAGASCVVAGLSLASGIAMPFVITLMLWRTGIPKRRLAAWALFAVGFAAVYLAGYVAPGPKLEGQVNPSLLEVLTFAAAYIGNAVMMAQLPVALAVALGVAGLSIFVWLSYRYLRHGSSLPFSPMAFAISAYVVGMVLMTSWGRAAFGLMAAGSNRYVTTSLVFWMAILGWAAAQANAKSRKRILGAALVVCFVYLIPTQFILAKKMRDQYVAYDEGSLALIVGVEDSLALYELYPTSPTLWKNDVVLREDGLSVYRESWAGLMGRSIAPADSQEAAEGVLQAELEEVRYFDDAVHPGRYLRGRIAGLADAGIPEVVLVTRGGQVVGIVKTDKRNCPGCFTGYVSGRDSVFEMRTWEPANGPGRPVSVRTVGATP